MSTTETYDPRDVEHLVDLLCMLHPPTDEYEDFWKIVTGPPGDVHYVTNKLSSEMWLYARGKPDVRDLAGRVLMFFETDRPEVWEVIGKRVCEFSDEHPVLIGRRWCEDACATAWRIFSAIEGAKRREHILRKVIEDRRSD